MWSYDATSVTRKNLTTGKQINFYFEPNCCISAWSDFYFPASTVAFIDDAVGVDAEGGGGEEELVDGGGDCAFMCCRLVSVMVQ